MSVKSALYAEKTYLITLSYERDKQYLPVKNWRTYHQNGREIRTLNLELNGTQWIKTRYIDKKTGKPIANTAATIYVIFEDEDKKNEEAVIKSIILQMRFGRCGARPVDWNAAPASL